jgi:hypothetical protein
MHTRKNVENAFKMLFEGKLRSVRLVCRFDGPKTMKRAATNAVEQHLREEADSEQIENQTTVVSDMIYLYEGMKKKRAGLKRRIAAFPLMRKLKDSEMPVDVVTKAERYVKGRPCHVVPAALKRRDPAIHVDMSNPPSFTDLRNKLVKRMVANTVAWCRANRMVVVKVGITTASISRRSAWKNNMVADPERLPYTYNQLIARGGQVVTLAELVPSEKGPNTDAYLHQALPMLEMETQQGLRHLMET